VTPAAAVLAAALAAGLAGGAAQAGEAAPVPSHPSPTLTIGEDRNGQEISVPAGVVFAVELASASGGGYLWSVARADPAVLEPLGAETVPAGDPRVLGAPSRQRFLFRARAPGAADLVLALARSWETGEPRRRFAVRVVVTPAPAPRD